MKSAGTMKLTKPKQIGRETIKNVSGNMAPFFRSIRLSVPIEVYIIVSRDGEKMTES